MFKIKVILIKGHFSKTESLVSVLRTNGLVSILSYKTFYKLLCEPVNERCRLITGITFNTLVERNCSHKI